jgi:hypothetical protein
MQEIHTPSPRPSQGRKRRKRLSSDQIASIRDGELHRVRTMWHFDGAIGTKPEIISYRGHCVIVSNFTFADYKAYGQCHGKHPRFVAPCDATPAEIRAYLKVERLKRFAKVRRERRAAAKLRKVEASDLNCRSSAIITVLNPDRWQSIRDLMLALKGLAVFTQPNGRPMKAASLRRVIARELAKPVTAQMIVTGMKPAKRGDVIIVKLRKLLETISSEAKSS